MLYCREGFSAHSTFERFNVRIGDTTHIFSISILQHVILCVWFQKLCFYVIQKRDTRDKARAKLCTDKDEELKAMKALQKEGKRMFTTIYNSDEGGIENEVEQAKERV